MSSKLTIGIVFFAIVLPSRPQAPKHPSSPTAPEKSKLFKHHGIVAWSCASPILSAFVYTGGLAVDADGAPRAYTPTDRPGLDSLGHAGHPGNWWALATDTGETSGRPVIQQKGDPAPGYYVSMTSLYDATIPNERNPRRFVDAAKIPYVVLPPEGLKHAKLGDFATVVNLKNGKIAAAIVADESAPDLPMGEGSIALADALGVDSNPRSGGAGQGVAFVIYPNSGNSKPRPLEEIVANGQHLFQAWGGLDKLHACLASRAEMPSPAEDDAETKHQKSAIEVPLSESVDHFLSGERLIQYTGPIDVVHLKIVVAPDGTVQAATPESVNTRWQDKAVSLAKTWRYVPFQIRGEPILATFSADVDVVPPERRPTQRTSSPEASFPEIKDWNSLRITLHRSTCYGTCPAYALVISGDGTVSYDGYDYVQYCGEIGGHVSQEVVQQLVSLFKKADYFNTFDRYAMGITDIPTYTTSISFDGKSKSVVDYDGLWVGMPEAVLDIENAIDRLTGPVWAKQIYADFGITRPCPRSPLPAPNPPSN